MIYLNKSHYQVTLQCYLMSEEDSEISYQQRVNQHGEVIGTGYLVQRTPTRIYLRGGKPSGMARRIMEYARAGYVKRTNGKK